MKIPNPCICGCKANISEIGVYLDNAIIIKCPECGAHSAAVLINHPAIDSKTGRLNESTRYTKKQARQKAIDGWNGGRVYGNA